MDYSDALRHLQQTDPTLALLIEQVGDCRLFHELQTGDVFHSLTESIIYQQLSGKAAGTIHRRFLELFGNNPAFSPEEVLQTTDEALRGVGLSRAKTLYVKDLAQKVLDGLPSMMELEQMEDESIIQTLIQVKGVGRWTAQMFLMFRLHRWDVLPTEDLGVRAGCQKVYGLTELPNKKTLEAIGEPWRPYRSIASWYLWRSLDQKLVPSN